MRFPFFPPQGFLNRKKKIQANEADRGHVPVLFLAAHRLGVRAPLANVELEMWIQCYG
jgi:hypothetical protein